MAWPSGLFFSTHGPDFLHAPGRPKRIVEFCSRWVTKFALNSLRLATIIASLIRSPRLNTGDSMIETTPIRWRTGISRMLQWTACLAAMSCIATPALAEFPDKPIRIIVSSSPGGYLDIISRAVGKELQERWRQPIIVENKPGASGVVGAVAVKNSQPDGYTWLAATEAHLVTNKFTMKNLPYDYKRDFVGISVLTRADQVVVATKDFPARTLTELIEIAKKDPKGLSYGSWGIGSHPHLFYSKLGSMTNANFVMIPYKGVAPTMQAMSAGEVPWSVMSPGTAKPLLEAGRLKILAAAARKRLPDLPDVPTTEELGFPGLTSAIYMVLLLPRETPPDVVAKASKAVQSILKQPDFAARTVTDHGFQVVASDSAGVTTEMDELGKLMAESVKAAQIMAQ